MPGTPLWPARWSRGRFFSEERRSSTPQLKKHTAIHVAAGARADRGSMWAGSALPCDSGSSACRLPLRTATGGQHSGWLRRPSEPTRAGGCHRQCHWRRQCPSSLDPRLGIGQLGCEAARSQRQGGAVTRWAAGSGGILRGVQAAVAGRPGAQLRSLQQGGGHILRSLQGYAPLLNESTALSGTGPGPQCA